MNTTKNVFSAVAKFFRDLSVQRAQRIALSELLQLSSARLDDLGIDYQDVVEALAAPPPAGPRMEQRREMRANGLRAVATD